MHTEDATTTAKIESTVGYASAKEKGEKQAMRDCVLKRAIINASNLPMDQRGYHKTSSGTCHFVALLGGYVSSCVH